MAAEQGGAAKRGEGLSWLASYAREQSSTPLGTVHVAFGDPLSLASALEAGADPTDPDARRLTLQKVAFQVAVGINSVTPATATALVTLALLGVRDRALTLGQVRRVVEPLIGFLDERGPAALRCAAAHVPRRAAGARDAGREGVVTVYDGGDEPVHAIERASTWWRRLPQQRDPPLRRPGDRRAGDAGRPADRWDEAIRLRDQLKFEFFFPERDAYRERIGAELERLDPDWATADGREVLCGAPLLVAHRVLRSFVDAQLVVAERLAARDPRTPVVEADFLGECGGMGQQMLLQGRLHGPESLSRELLPARCSWPATSTWSTRPRGAGPPGRMGAQVRDVVRRWSSSTARRRGAAGECGSGP